MMVQKYFGPYANAGAAKEMVDFIKDKFKIRQCKNFKYKDRPCLNYHIKKNVLHLAWGIYLKKNTKKKHR